METSGPKGQWRSEMDQDKKGETERSASKSGMEFHLRERGIGDECGKVPVLIWGGEEFADEEIQVSVRREENVGDIA